MQTASSDSSRTLATAAVVSDHVFTDVIPDIFPDTFPASIPFLPRHVGASEDEINGMLAALGCNSLDSLCNTAVPHSIRLKKTLRLPDPSSEQDALAELRSIADKNKIFRSYIGTGYNGTITPPVIQRLILENPGWYTAYTPYQAEIAQGRLEALLNFQTLVCDLTGMPVANASLLDEATAAAEAVTMCLALRDAPTRNTVFAAASCHPQTLAVIKTRCRPLGIRVEIGDPTSFLPTPEYLAVIVQYPDTEGVIRSYSDLAEISHSTGTKLIVAADLLSLALLAPPSTFGADIVIGSAQRFGVPMGFGGPHAAFMATRDELKRSMPGRLIGVSRDADGRPGYRLSLQTREQHIRREKATSNICTAQVLLAVMASMYAVYHGPAGVKAIASRIHQQARRLATALRSAGHSLASTTFFDTLRVSLKPGINADAVHAALASAKINLRLMPDNTFGISLDETVTESDLRDLASCFNAILPAASDLAPLPSAVLRKGDILRHPIFHQHHTETELMRYIKRLEAKDVTLTHSMIPLGSCTMKLNAASEMQAVTWPEFGALHPHCPSSQSKGYTKLAKDLEKWLSEVTGFSAVSLQPNAGSQGEYAGLLAIRGWHEADGQPHRTVCLIPTSAHGTNPASAVMAGFQVVGVRCETNGDIDMSDLEAKCVQHAENLAALMVTYPSTHGVFETTIKKICKLVHDHGGQVYMDGANMNAQVGLCRPGDIGADVCHLNLHKTFCIPHGGGGPGVGPIGVAKHLAPFLPSTSWDNSGNPTGYAVGPVSAAPLGSATILVIPWMYIRMLGAVGLSRSTQVAILNANYVAHRLKGAYPVLFTGPGGFVAHECVLDCRPFKTHGIEVEDIAKRLMDFGFHAPTMSWPVPGTLMVEPTESESREELDRFCDAMLSIAEEIRAVSEGRLDKVNNPLKRAPHPADSVCSDSWDRPYSREQAAYPAPWLRTHKYWPPVSRIDNVYGDRNLVCTCPPMEE